MKYQLKKIVGDRRFRKEPGQPYVFEYACSAVAASHARALNALGYRAETYGRELIVHEQGVDS